MKRVLAAGMFMAVCPAIAQAIEVYPGCPVPSIKPSHRNFYVDPVKGSDQGDGSAAKPWKNLTAVIGMSNKLLSAKAWSNKNQSYGDVNPSGPIKAGDVVILMSGNYGTLKILNSFNTDFVWVMAGPGQTPVIRQMNIVSSAKFVFQGIKFQGGSPSTNTDVKKKPLDGQVTVGDGDYTGISNNVVFSNDTFSTTDDTRGWSDADWILKPYFTTFSSRVSCVSLTNSKIYNVFNGAMMGKDSNFFANNVVDYFQTDGIDITYSNITVRGNTFTNGNINKLNGYHADAIQGWSNLVNGAYTTNSNVRIEDNKIIKLNDPDSYLQGISIFDGKWDNLIVQNNVVVTDTNNGIAVFGAKNSSVINNTVVSSGSTQALLWISHGKDGSLPSNILVRNNIAPVLAVAEPGVSYDHNIFTSKLIGKEGSITVALVKSGQPSTQTTLVPTPSSLFVKLDNANGAYDLRLKGGSAGIGAGSPAKAPTTDITGKTRKVPVDIGAYSN
ncbi:right-handed parallel beta-helix repeat-containing protein [Lichenifustis flavocetrariae]|uniref:Right-handed parallel beta-helix repeat-containing protein n=1 Tax=Lichenifustis flavocetrariae TaxID=2949735 RepID=A0AA42CMP5_9HYPH|nr:right-handed parallel beta-helix repeat-containing protein [Lichenifustis flavocetrariae]MCW6508570.1 right-handed parallel beta-helix repeat-containing protein [Lichenifustis flavocetrariae]